MRREVNPSSVTARHNDRITPTSRAIDSKCLCMSANGERLGLLSFKSGSSSQGKQRNKERNTCNAHCHFKNDTRRKALVESLTSSDPFPAGKEISNLIF